MIARATVLVIPIDDLLLIGFGLSTGWLAGRALQ
ncbi:hypothetical protein EDC40_101133 [Aminobacter aminovorans]|uniref:Uncharacterized protein n=1 Tax=Aminobacter aminovorans TaxID=83263 RepID=A0A380WP06_AMIAI|nr:hypothetical protein EDC40_101133 [Aminobacter aminovorans]SUU90667.1 Uncharacterised protein [Aminobacter aminovorans]